MTDRISGTTSKVEGREASPSAAVLDSQSGKSVEKVR
jgi:hypothetical protein